MPASERATALVLAYEHAASLVWEAARATDGTTFRGALERLDAAQQRRDRTRDSLLDYVAGLEAALERIAGLPEEPLAVEVHPLWEAAFRAGIREPAALARAALHGEEAAPR